MVQQKAGFEPVLKLGQPVHAFQYCLLSSAPMKVLPRALFEIVLGMQMKIYFSVSTVPFEEHPVLSHWRLYSRRLKRTATDIFHPTELNIQKPAFEETECTQKFHINDVLSKCSNMFMSTFHQP